MSLICSIRKLFQRLKWKANWGWVDWGGRSRKKQALARSWCSNGIWSMIERQMGGGTPLWPSIVTSLLPGLCTLDRGVGRKERGVWTQTKIFIWFETRYRTQSICHEYIITTCYKKSPNFCLQNNIFLLIDLTSSSLHWLWPVCHLNIDQLPVCHKSFTSDECVNPKDHLCLWVPIVGSQCFVWICNKPRKYKHWVSHIHSYPLLRGKPQGHLFFKIQVRRSIYSVNLSRMVFR